MARRLDVGANSVREVHWVLLPYILNPDVLNVGSIMLWLTPYCW